MKPIDELTRAELAAEFRAVIAEANRRGVKADAGLISDWYALRQSTPENLRAGEYGTGTEAAC